MRVFEMQQRLVQKMEMAAETISSYGVRQS